jgi:CRISPR-associated endoribonuclease Cas6
MLNRLDIILEDENINYNMGSIFHGYLMSIVDNDYANYLHHNSINPYSSFVYYSPETNRNIWRINTLDSLSKEMIIDNIYSKNIKEIYLDNHFKTYKVEKVIIYPEKTYEELYLDNHINSRIQFLTPTSFKSNNIYQIFPRLDLMIFGVIRKINTYSKELRLEDETVLNEIINHIFISDYFLKSAKFFLEKVRINSFIGKINIKSNLNEEYCKLLYFIIKVAEYSGIGIKTALGMGGINIE